REILRGGRKVRLRVTGCHGFCQMEPSILVEPDRTYYPRVAARDVPRIVEAAAAGGAVEELLFLDPEGGERIRRQDDIPFFRRQVRTIISRNERVDPLRIGDAIECGGYAAFAALLGGGNPRAAIDEVKTSGLRGR